MSVEAFALAALGCLVTNFDNILLVVSGGGRLSALRGSLAFVVVLSLAILVGFAISLGIDVTVPAAIAWVGLVPVSMGVYELFTRAKDPEPATTGRTGSLLALALLLAVNSMDTVAVQAVLFSDIASQYHVPALAGAFSAAAAMAALAWYIISSPAAARHVLPLAARLRPWLLIVIGALILMDTGFDAI